MAHFLKKPNVPHNPRFIYLAVYLPNTSMSNDVLKKLPELDIIMCCSGLLLNEVMGKQVTPST